MWIVTANEVINTIILVVVYTIVLLMMGTSHWYDDAYVYMVENKDDNTDENMVGFLFYFIRTSCKLFYLDLIFLDIFNIY